MFLLIFLTLVGTHYSSSLQLNSTLPTTVPPTVFHGTSPGVCPSAEDASAQINATKQEIRNLLRNVVNPKLDGPPPCSCGDPGEWSMIAHLDMEDPSQQCPSNWRLTTSPVRACGRYTSACDSVSFSSNGRSYSHVCGRIIAYQKGTTDAFLGASRTLESSYIDGVSLTHGAAGSRRHIWSFVAALYEMGPDYRTYLGFNCPCTNTNFNWPYQVPSYVGNNYFCDTGNSGPELSSSVYPDDPLWDGQGCGPTNTCCQLNNPPWFCTTLPQPTSDDIELRICGSEDPVIGEDVLVKLIDIYVK